MRDLNEVTLIGRLGKDLELKQTKFGQSQIQFSIANNRDYRDKDGNKVEVVNWVNCVAYSKLAENMAKYLHKGSKIAVHGELQVRRGQDRNGVERDFVSILLTDVNFLDSKSDNADTAAQPTQSYASAPFEPYTPYTSETDIF